MLSFAYFVLIYLESVRSFILYPNQITTCTPGAIFESEVDCHSFYQCFSSVTPPVKMSCGFLLFNPYSRTCDWPANVISIRPECSRAFSYFSTSEIMPHLESITTITSVLPDDIPVPLTESAGAEHPGVDSPFESVDIVTRPDTVTKLLGMTIENGDKDHFLNTNEIEDQSSELDDPPGTKVKVPRLLNSTSTPLPTLFEILLNDVDSDEGRKTSKEIEAMDIIPVTTPGTLSSSTSASILTTEETSTIKEEEATTLPSLSTSNTLSTISLKEILDEGVKNFGTSNSSSLEKNLTSQEDSKDNFDFALEESGSYFPTANKTVSLANDKKVLTISEGTAMNSSLTKATEKTGKDLWTEQPETIEKVESNLAKIDKNVSNVEQNGNNNLENNRVTNIRDKQLLNEPQNDSKLNPTKDVGAKPDRNRNDEESNPHIPDVANEQEYDDDGQFGSESLRCDCSCPCADQHRVDYDYPEQDLRPKNGLKSEGGNGNPTFVEMAMEMINASRQETATYFPIKEFLSDKTFYTTLPPPTKDSESPKAVDIATNPSKFFQAFDFLNVIEQIERGPPPELTTLESTATTASPEEGLETATPVPSDEISYCIAEFILCLEGKNDQSLSARSRSCYQSFQDCSGSVILIPDLYKPNETNQIP